MLAPKKIIAEEIVVPFPAPRERLRLAVKIRSTLIASSVRAIRERGRFDDYVAQLPDAWRDLPVRAIVGAWLPIDAGLAHYRACDALGFSVRDQVANGRETGDRIHGTFLGTMVRAAKTVGVTPWSALSYTPKLYERLFDGGGFCITKIGPKDAHAEMACNPLAANAYFRNAHRGLWQAAIDLFCEKSYVTEMGRTGDSYTVRISWA